MQAHRSIGPAFCHEGRVGSVGVPDEKARDRAEEAIR